jgi:predicted Zn finger-like uncharacterized protein
MPIPTTCPSCQTVYPLADHLRGKKVRCKNCGAAIQVGHSPTSQVTEEADDDGQYRIQTEAREPSRSPNRTDDDERPRRRQRDDRDEPKIKSNHGLIIGLAVGCGALLLLMLVGGGILAFILLGNDSTSNTPNSGANVIPPQAIPPRPQAAPPGAGGEADNAGPVFVHVSGVNSEIMRDAIQEKLRQLVDPGPVAFVHGFEVNGQLTFHVMPVKDPQAFAAKINFGKVQSVQGRNITMIAGKIEGIPGPDADSVERALFDLKSSDFFKRQQAVQKLKDALPDQRRAEVCKALAPLVNDPNRLIRQWAVEALGVWGTKESVPVLLKAMDDNETRRAAIEALGRLKDERAVEPIASRLEENLDRRTASEALKRMGPIAEEAVLKRLSHPDRQVARTACDILVAIGTKKSLPELQKIVAGGNAVLKRKAQEAIQAINARE